MAREATDGLYIELDYYTPENYHTYTAEASMIAGEYIDNGYIDLDYFQPSEGTGLFALTCDLTEVVGELKEFAGALSVVASTAPSAVKTVVVDTSLTVTATESSTVGAIKQGEIALTGAFSPSISAVAILRPDVFLESSVSFAATAVKTASNEVILSYLASLDAQAARTRGFDTALSASFGNSTTTARFRDTDSSLAVAFTATTDNTRTRDASANLSSAFSTSTTAIKLQPGEIPLSVSASATIDGKALSERPLVTVTENLLYASANPQYGSYSGYISGTNSLEYIVHNNLMPDNTDEWFIEGWVDNSGSNDTIFALSYDEDNSSSNSNIFFFGEVNNNNVYILIRNADGANASQSTTEGDLDGTWQHFVFAYKPGSGIKLWLDGSELLTVTNRTSVELRENKFGRLFFGRSYIGDTYTDDFNFLDEVRVVKGANVLSQYGYTFSNSSITVPTSVFTDTVDTKLLLHFENNSEDDFIAGLAQASLSATASVSVTVGNTKQFASDISSAFTLSGSGDLIIEGNATLDSAGTVDATIGSIKQFEAALTNAFSPSIVAVAVKNTFAILDTNTTLGADVDRLQGIIEDLSSAFSVSADVDRFLGTGTSTLTARATVVADINVIYHPIRSLVHFDTLSAGVPQDERTSVNWSGTVGQFTIPNLPSQGYYTAFDKMARFDNGVLYDYDDTNAPTAPDFDGPTTDYADRVYIGTQPFCIDFKVRIGGVEGEVSNDRIPLVSIQYLDSASSDESITVYQRPLYIAVDKGSTNATIRVDGLNVSGYSGLPTLTATIPLTDIDDAYHITVNRQIVGNDATYRLFVNGIVEDSATKTNEIQPIQSHSTYDTYWQLGGYWFERTNQSNSFFGGYIDEFRLIIGSPAYLNDFTVPVVEYSLIFEELEAEISSAFNFTIDPSYINEVPANLSAQFTQILTPSITRGFIATNLSTQIDAVIDAIIVTDTSAELSNQFSISIDAVKTTDVDSAMSVATEIVTDNVRAKLFNVDLDSAFTLPDVAYDFFRGLAISAEATATVESEVFRIKQLGASLTGAFSPTVDANAILRPDVFLEAQATITEVEPVIFAGAQSNVSSAFTLEVAAERTVDYVADLSVTAPMPDANVFRIQPAEANLSSAFISETINARTRDNTIALDTAISAQITPIRVRYYNITLNTLATVNATAQLIVEAEATLSAVFDDTFVVTRLRKAEADLEAFAFTVSVGDAINIDAYRQLIVPSETRLLKVAAESRRIIAPSETRILEV